MTYPRGTWNPEPPIPPMDHTPGFKESAFSWAMAKVILWHIARGRAMKRITVDPKLPSYATVYQWMKMVPEFGDRVADARAKLAAERLAARDAARRAGPVRRRGGRRQTVSAEALDALLNRVREGMAVSVATAQPGAPSTRALYSRLKVCPGFRAAYVDACGWRQFLLEGEADDARHSVREVGYRAARARYEALLAQRGRLTPKLYRELA
jgi:hypothetical protein